MIKTQQYTQNLFDSRDVAIAGGKAVNLGQLIRAGFPVPGGFVVTTQAFTDARQAAGGAVPSIVPDNVREEIAASYRTMGLGRVAVRSSATAEDMGNASMAGQYETFLDIEGEAALLDAVQKCWASLDQPRTRAYLHEHGIDLKLVSMAVVVQRLVHADVAGVLFTANPHDGAFHEMLVEASWGLGEMVVSGKVQPDVLRLERATGKVISATIADKHIHLSVGRGEEQPVEEARRRLPCLHGKDVNNLWELGKKTAEHFGSPQDIEWAIHDGELYLLQSRPITTIAESAAREEIIKTTRQRLKQQRALGLGPWAQHNLGETLPHPTPLTWSVIKRFMSGSGGFGSMYRAAGFIPSESVNREGFLELIAGKVYMDLSRAAEMFFDNFPFAYDVEELKRSPDASQAPPTLPKGSIAARAGARRKLLAVQEKLQDISKEFDSELRERVFPEIEEYVAREQAIDLRKISATELITSWQARENQVMDLFGPRLLMPSLISGMALGELRSFLEEHFWEEDADVLAQFISSGGLANRTVVADAELYEVAHGTRPMENWLASHGHRAAGEFDLSAPRWRERPAKAREMAGHLATGGGPMERHGRTAVEVEQKVQSLRTTLAGQRQAEFDRHVDLVRRYVTFREDAKDFLMMGYDLLRDVALEAARRVELPAEEIFFLTREELFEAIKVGIMPQGIVETRKLDYRAEEKIALPQVIDATAIDTLGQEADSAVEPARAGTGHKAFAISRGEAIGPARILTSPTDPRDLGTGYILICPSTDPSWTPLFVNAAGLVLECGGTLSHGAVVAREMGLPAVVLPGATKMFKDGEAIHVDGKHGWVGLAAEKAPKTVDELPDPDNTFIPRRLIPPPASTKDRKAAKLRNWCAAAWTVYLLAFFLLPTSFVKAPALALMDATLWPIARAWGKPTVVIFIAVIIAAVTLILQRVLTDNRRLLEAKKRATALKKEADTLPEGSRRRSALLAWANPVTLRTLGAAMVPVGLLLGPMVMPFVWMQERIDPSVQVGTVGAPVQVVAMVDSNWLGPVGIVLPANMKLDDSTPQRRTLPPIKATLERLLTLYRQPTNRPEGQPWELQIAPDLARQQTIEDLEAYLKSAVPPQPVSWRIIPRENFEGSFLVGVASGKAVEARAVIGTSQSPAPTSWLGGDQVREVKIVYAKNAEQKVFLRPFAFLGGRLGEWDIGWVWLYIVAYLPVLFGFRWLLKVA